MKTNTYKIITIALTILSLALSEASWGKGAEGGIGASFSDANAQYAAGNYADAALLYEQILTEQPSADVYYNLGNARYKQGEIAQSILAYERCLRLRPTHKEARYNLHLAQERITDKIEDNTTFFLSSWARSLRNLLSSTTWFAISIGAFWIMLVAVLCFLLCRPVWLRKSGFYIALITLLISLASGANAISLRHRDTARNEAIITRGIVNAKSGPDKSSTDLFTLHEGTAVTIHEVIGDWCNIHVGNSNNVGWIPLSTLERI